MNMKKTATTINVFFCGTGGQGVLSASEVCGWAAVYDGYHVKKSEVHGMAQRGGSVESNLRFGKNVFSPLTPLGRADYLVSFHPDEHARCLGMLSEGGVDLISSLDVALNTIEDKRYVNTYLLGVLSRYVPISEKSWMRALARAFKSKNLAENSEIFLKGKREATA
jgi:indolepyruvate ferredoxin oxidoreductase, beta subunit